MSKYSLISDDFFLQVRAFTAENRETEVFSKEVEYTSELKYENLGFSIGLF